jgi:5,10-methylene-tetrahydrofolate dehydrogenase/methenyl tetrahydrofolate cyclohydrolase
MPAAVIDGKKIAEIIRAELKLRVEEVKAQNPGAMSPGLCAIIVGGRKDSETYVRLKQKAAEECGFVSIPAAMPEVTTQEELEAKIDELNNDPRCHGIIVQLPLPSHLSEERAILKISPLKDADCLHPYNVGMMALRGQKPTVLPCTPAGVIELLKRSNVTISGKRAIVLGRSNIVGMPVSILLQKEDATVTTVHSRTQDIPSLVREADIVVSAMGKPEMVKGAWLKEGAVVIDVSTTPVDDATKKSGFRLVGDVCYEEACAVVSQITPVPGGVGPMTIAMLLKNTLKCYEVTL